MTLEQFVQQYGGVAVFLGAGLEGEAAVVAGGLLAHQGLFPLPAAMAAAALGSFVADQGWFAAGRRLRGHRWLDRWRKRAAFARAVAAVERRPIGFIFVFRFLYGLRTISPIAIGTTRVPARLFLPVNAVSAAIWGVVFSLIGYLFGREFEAWVGRLKPHGAQLWWIVGGVVALGLLAGAVHWWRSREA